MMHQFRSSAWCTWYVYKVLNHSTLQHVWRCVIQFLCIHWSFIMYNIIATLDPSSLLWTSIDTQACMHSNQCHIYMWAPSAFFHSQFSTCYGSLHAVLKPPIDFFYTLYCFLSLTHFQVVTAQPTSAAHPSHPPETYMAWSIFTCLCCACPCGLMAIMYSIKVNCWLGMKGLSHYLHYTVN